ncbi:MAG TPA: hypothetical protein VFU86_23975 [Terriglobales bacterium]|nr:hypothetical protein [Terriglobales bacterium]
MTWALLGIGAIILFWFLRRLGREQSVVSYPANPAQPIAAPAAEPIFALRSPMSFDEFYQQYYAADHIDPSFVRQVLELISKTGGIPAEQLRPEDRLDQLPKHMLYRGVQFVESMLEAGIRKRAIEQGIPPIEFHLETIDDLIRQLEPHHLEAFKMHEPPVGSNF